MWNRTDYRPLEGFVYAITPFNFTAIAGNLPTAPALMGNTVVWKPSPTQTFAAYLTMQLLEAAGLPPGVINLVAGDGIAVSDVALADPRLAGIHFTGSTATFQHLWREVGTNIDRYHTYPRLVGETGGKDFVLAHPSARPDVLRTALIRGAFDYQGQKCSAASRAFVPRSVWQQMGDDFLGATEALRYGDVTDLTNFGGALIDDRAFAKNVKAIERAKGAAGVTVAAGGEYDDSEGYFVRPTVLLSDDPGDESFSTEYFGPILSVHVYPDSDYEQMLDVVDSGAKYALTGAVIADDRDAVLQAQNRLRFAAGNFYVNDKPTGAVVGQQPFGGSRASGTNDKAGSPLNLLRWTSARSIKETFVPPPTTTTRTWRRSDDGAVFHRVARPAILAASRSDGLRRTAERLPVTRDVVHRFVPGETVADALNSVAQLRDGRRLVSIDYLGEDTTEVEDAETTVRAYLELLDALGSARRSAQQTPCGRWRCR